jgi:putative phosphoribosyl transferase
MNSQPKMPGIKHGARKVLIQAGGVALEGEWMVPDGAAGIVFFAHGSGSSRHSPRNQSVARHLQSAGIGTLLFDLLTTDEEFADGRTGEFRFDIGLLARRLVAVTRWVARQKGSDRHAVGYFGSSTGGAAALVAAAELGSAVGAVVSRGGRPDLAGNALERVISPTLLIVGERDESVLRLNEEACDRLACVKDLAIVPRATHLFEEPGALEKVSQLAGAWFQKHLRAPSGKVE